VAPHVGLDGLGGFGGLAQRQGVRGTQHGPEVQLGRLADLLEDLLRVRHAGDRHGDLVGARRTDLRPGNAEIVHPQVEDVDRLFEVGRGDMLLLRLVDDGHPTRQVEAELGGPFGREDGGK
jgi:hypothetical protein